MELYLVTFYDHNESGNVVHNELYTTRAAAQRRFNSLQKNLNCYSWVYLYSARSFFGRVKSDKCLDYCQSCEGNSNYYHGDSDDF